MAGPRGGMDSDAFNPGASTTVAPRAARRAGAVPAVEAAVVAPRERPHRRFLRRAGGPATPTASRATVFRSASAGDFTQHSLHATDAALRTKLVVHPARARTSESGREDGVARE